MPRGHAESAPSAHTDADRGAPQVAQMTNVYWQDVHASHLPPYNGHSSPRRAMSATPARHTSNGMSFPQRSNSPAHTAAAMTSVRAGSPMHAGHPAGQMGAVMTNR